MRGNVRFCITIATIRGGLARHSNLVYYVNVKNWNKLINFLFLFNSVLLIDYNANISKLKSFMNFFNYWLNHRLYCPASFILWIYFSFELYIHFTLFLPLKFTLFVPSAFIKCSCIAGNIFSDSPRSSIVASCCIKYSRCLIVSPSKGF